MKDIAFIDLHRCRWKRGAISARATRPSHINLGKSSPKTQEFLRTSVRVLGDKAHDLVTGAVWPLSLGTVHASR